MFVCLLAIYLVFRFELHKRIVYRLALYQVLASMFFATAEVLEVIFVKDQSNTTGIDILRTDGYGRACIAVGWFVVYTQWMKLLFTMCVTVHLFCFAVFYKNLKNLEVPYVVTSLTLPAAIACVPLIRNAYALSPSRKCYIDHTALAERFALFNAPAMLSLLVLSVAMVIMVVKLTRRLRLVLSRYENLAGAGGGQHQKALKQLLPLSAFPILFFIFMLPVVSLDIYDAKNSVTSPRKDVSIINAVCTSMWSFTSGMTLIIHMACVRCTETKRRRKDIQ